MKPEIPLRGGDEYDAFSSRWRHWVYWQRGELRRIKRGYGKRVRRIAKQEIRQRWTFSVS